MLKEKYKKRYIILICLLIGLYVFLTILTKLKQENSENIKIKKLLEINQTNNNIRNCEELKKIDNIIYMFINNKTDIDFYRNQKIDNHLVYIIESTHNWPKEKICCLRLNDKYEYETLDSKVFETLIMIRYYFPNFKTISKLDDDAIISYNYYQDLMKNITINTYAGLFKGYYLEGFGIFNFATGHFYTLGKEAIQCILKNYRIFRKNEKSAEDLTIGYTVSELCKSIKSLHLDKNIAPIYHKKYNINKNKSCDLTK